MVECSGVLTYGKGHGYRNMSVYKIFEPELFGIDTKVYKVQKLNPHIDRLCSNYGELNGLPYIHFCYDSSFAKCMKGSISVYDKNIANIRD